METIFFHFLRQQSTTASGNSSSSTGTYFSDNLSYLLVKTSLLSTETVLFYSEFFLLVETIIETRGTSIFKEEIYSC